MATQVAFFDIAGTVVRGDPWNDLLHHPQVGRHRVRTAYFNVLPVWLGRKAKLVDDVRFRHRWLHAMAAIFKGWPEAELKRLFEWVVKEQMAADYQAVVVDRLKQHKEKGDRIVLVSGMFDGLVQAFADHLGAHAAIGSQLGFRQGMCTGQIVGPSIAGMHKLGAIREYLNTLADTGNLTDCFAYADSFSDAPMLAAVGRPVATYPDAELRALALDKGWMILPA